MQAKALHESKHDEYCTAVTTYIKGRLACVVIYTCAELRLKNSHIN